MSVPNGQRWRLLATFNGGFIYSDGSNGSSIGGRQYEPLNDGPRDPRRLSRRARRRAGWQGGPVAGPQIAFARQSLPLIIDHGRLNPALNDSSQWGYTLGNAVRVWRTGAGIDRHGNLIYAAADCQTVDHAGEDPAACRRRARNAARHQPGMADADHLHPPRRPGSDARSCLTTSSRHAVPGRRTTATSSPSTGALRGPSPSRSSSRTPLGPVPTVSSPHRAAVEPRER